MPAGTVSFRIRNQGPTTHEVIFVRTNLAPDKLTLQDDGLTVDEEARGIKFLEEVEGLDIDDRQTLVLDLSARQLRPVLQPGGSLPGGDV